MRRRRSRLRRRYGHRHHGHRRYGHEHVGVLSALLHMENARKAYRAARERGARAAFNAALNANRHALGTGAWDIASKVKKEMGD